MGITVITVARKPLSEGSVAENVLKWETGGLNTDGVRIPTTDKLGGGRLNGPTDMTNTCGGPEWDRPWMHDESKRAYYAEDCRKVERAERLGRWPSNLVLQHKPGCRREGTAAWTCVPGCPVAELDEQAGDRRSAGLYPTSWEDPNRLVSLKGLRQGALYDDSGGASRYFKQVASDE